jgi:hypothetical protein
MNLATADDVISCGCYLAEHNETTTTEYCIYKVT